MNERWMEQVTASLKAGVTVREGMAGECARRICEAAEVVVRSLRAGGKVLFCGNGGSAADAQHLAAEFVGRFVKDRVPLPAIALTTDSSYVTSVGNDYGFEHIFERAVRGLGRAGDVLVGISTSGKSPNVVKAVEAARGMGMKTIVLTGGTGGVLAGMADVAIVVPSTVTARIQEGHITAGHILCELMEMELIDEKSGAMRDGGRYEVNGLPTISIVVPNYNGGKTLEGTLRSIIEQDYPNLEIIVMDGGSKDNSVEIIKRYEKHLTYWESAKDRGQSDAINKGFAKCTGEIVNWLCSDDLLLPGALAEVGRVMSDAGVDMCIGRCRWTYLDEPGRDEVLRTSAEQVRATVQWCLIPQSSCFYRRRLLDREPPVVDFNYAMDQELWCYFLEQGARFVLTEAVLSQAVQDGSNKMRTADFRRHMETDRIWRQYAKGMGRPLVPRWYMVGVRWSVVYVEGHPRGMMSWLAGRWIGFVGWLQKMWRRGRSVRARMSRRGGNAGEETRS